MVKKIIQNTWINHFIHKKLKIKCSPQIVSKFLKVLEIIQFFFSIIPLDFGYHCDIKTSSKSNPHSNTLQFMIFFKHEKKTTRYTVILNWLYTKIALWFWGMCISTHFLKNTFALIKLIALLLLYTGKSSTLVH